MPDILPTHRQKNGAKNVAFFELLIIDRNYSSEQLCDTSWH